MARSLFFERGRLSDEQSSMKYKGIMAVTTEENIRRFVETTPENFKPVKGVSGALHPRFRRKLARFQRPGGKKIR